MKKKIAVVLTSVLMLAGLLSTSYLTPPVASQEGSHWKIMLAQKYCNAWITGWLTDIDGYEIPGTAFFLNCTCELPDPQPLGQFVFWKVWSLVPPHDIHYVKNIDLDKDGIPEIEEPINDLIPSPGHPNEEEPHTWYQHVQEGDGPFGHWMVVVEVREQPYDPDRPFFDWQLMMKTHGVNATWTGQLTLDGVPITGTDFSVGPCRADPDLQCQVVQTAWCTVPNDILGTLTVDETPILIDLLVTQFPWKYTYGVPGANVTLELTEVQMHHYPVMGGWMNTAASWWPSGAPGWNLSGWMYGEGFPFGTRAPYLTPSIMRQNITFTQRDPITGIVELRVPAESYVGLNHTFYAPSVERWIRVQVFLEQQGCGWLFTGEGKESVLGSVDLLTHNNDSGVYTFGPDHTAKTADDELLAGEVWNGTHYSGSAGAGPPLGPCLQLLRGSDGVPGTGDDSIGRGDPDGPNPPGSSILYVPTRMNATEWNPLDEKWEVLFPSIPWHQLLTTGTANDTVIEPLSLIDGTNSTRKGQPWEYYAGLDHPDQQVPWKDLQCNAYVHYVTVWSMLNVFTNLGYMDILFEFEEKKVREDCVIPDINCDEIVDFKDLYLAARAFFTMDEGPGPDGVPGTGDDKPVADPYYDARCDVFPDGIIDILDLVVLVLDYDFVPGYHVPDTWQGTISAVPLSPCANVGETFEVNLNVSDVTDLYLVLFCIRWNPAVLSLTGPPTPGDFLPGTPYHVYARINHTGGYLEAWTGTLLGSGSGVSGSGTVARLEFEVLSVSLNYSLLDLYNCSWMDSATGQYGFTTIQDGVFVPWNVNDDTVIDVEDLTIVSLALWAEPGKPKWNPDADINCDNIIDIEDLTLVSIHLWETW